MTHLVDTAKLEINIEVLLVERLHTRVHQTTQERRFNLLDDFCTGLCRIVQRRQRTQPIRNPLARTHERKHADPRRRTGNCPSCIPCLVGSRSP